MKITWDVAVRFVSAVIWVAIAIVVLSGAVRIEVRIIDDRSQPPVIVEPKENSKPIGLGHAE